MGNAGDESPAYRPHELGPIPAASRAVRAGSRYAFNRSRLLTSGSRVFHMNHQHTLSQKRAEILSIAGRYGARNVRVFGSVARAQDDEQSDFDFLVDMEPGRSLFDLGGTQSELESALGRAVDVVTEKGLKARIRTRVLREAIPV
jgi:predicted nucleotidyltransferase